MFREFVTVAEIAKQFKLKNLTPDIDLNNFKVTQKSINRPAFQLTGYYKYFDVGRIQILGKAEDEYIKELTEDEKEERFDRLFAYRFPAMIISRNIVPDPKIIESAMRYNVPVLSAVRDTAQVSVEIIAWLNIQMAPYDTRHGVLVDVFGEGILITGDTGIGKSETAIELVKRGHRLVADDLVEISKVEEDKVIGMAPELTRHFVELRGIGVVDLKSLYGVESVKTQSQIDMIIHLEAWDGKTQYDRLGLEEQYEEILGVKLVKCTIPIRPGRNLAIVIETAAVNNRQKKMGYNAAEAIVERVRNEVRNKKAEMEAQKENEGNK